MSSSRGLVAPTVSSSGVVAVAQLQRVGRLADVGVQNERDAFRAELIDAPDDVLLGHLEVGDAVGEQPTGAVVALVDGDRVPGAAELLRRGQPGRAAADDRRPTSRSRGVGGSGTIQPFFPARDRRSPARWS